MSKKNPTPPRLMPVILATWEAEIGRIALWGQPGQIVWQTPISKATGAKWIGGVFRVVECQLCKHEALRLNLIPAKKDEKEKPYAYWKNG
jgi:hypothetical protein